MEGSVKPSKWARSAVLKHSKSPRSQIRGGTVAYRFGYRGSPDQGIFLSFVIPVFLSMEYDQPDTILEGIRRETYY